MPRGVRGSGTTKPKQLSPEEARQERERLQAQLRALEEQDARRYTLIGRALTEYAERDPEFAARVTAILTERITDRGERACLGLPTARRGRPRKAKAGTPELSGDQPDRGAEMA